MCIYLGNSLFKLVCLCSRGLPSLLSRLSLGFWKYHQVTSMLRLFLMLGRELASSYSFLPLLESRLFSRQPVFKLDLWIYLSKHLWTFTFRLFWKFTSTKNYSPLFPSIHQGYSTLASQIFQYELVSPVFSASGRAFYNVAPCFFLSLLKFLTRMFCSWFANLSVIFSFFFFKLHQFAYHIKKIYFKIIL